MTCYASDLEGRKDEPVPPDLWFVMQLSHSALEAATTAPTGLASSTMRHAVRKRRRVKPDMWEQNERSRLQLS